MGVGFVGAVMAAIVADTTDDEGRAASQVRSLIGRSTFPHAGCTWLGDAPLRRDDCRMTTWLDPLSVSRAGGGKRFDA